MKWFYEICLTKCTDSNERERERSFEISYPIIVSEILLRLQIHCIEVEINDNFCRKLSNKM